MSTIAQTARTVEERLTRLEDIAEITRLKYRYMELCDAGFDGDGIGELFAPDGVWSVPGAGEFVGPEAIAAFFNGQAANIPWCLHYATNPIIDVADDGETATGRFLLHMVATIANPPQDSPDPASIFVGTYADTFVKRDGRWYFASINGIGHRNTGWTSGWANGWRA